MQVYTDPLTKLHLATNKQLQLLVLSSEQDNKIDVAILKPSISLTQQLEAG